MEDVIADLTYTTQSAKNAGKSVGLLSLDESGAYNNVNFRKTVIKFYDLLKETE